MVGSMKAFRPRLSAPSSPLYPGAQLRRLGTSSKPTEDATASANENKTGQPPDTPAHEPDGALALRLEQATEDALLSSPRAAARSIEQGTFSPELKERLLAKIAAADLSAASSSAQHAQAWSQVTLPSSAPASVRADAAATIWTGTETTEQAVLRMLEDAHKPLRWKSDDQKNTAPVDMRLRRGPRRTPGEILGDARDRAATYSGLNENEREALRKEFGERFAPAARAVPVSINALAALANERIEDAMARGQFKNVPRGKGIERDARADNPFVDTTEYLMNKMIKRQDIVPPWIEKQQQLAKAATAFRSELRADWTRHATHRIASEGGTLDSQTRRARAHARAELVQNPRMRNVDTIAVPTNLTDDPVMAGMREARGSPPAVCPSGHPSPCASDANADNVDEHILPPLRDRAWETAQRKYHMLCIDKLNALARSYNLMAPELAKKPYFSLERELGSCFADVAPALADEVRTRAQAGKPRQPASSGGFLRAFVDGGRDVGVQTQGMVKRAESAAKAYGFRELWRDMWKK